MKEQNIQNANKAITITTVLTLFVAGFEAYTAYCNYKPGMNFFDLASYVTSNRSFYCLILILANIILLPSAVMLYKQNGVSMKKEICTKETLGRDIAYGLVALGATELIGLLGLLFGKINYGRTALANTYADNSIGTIIIEIIALAFVSGIFKEFYFRGFAKTFCGPVMGETCSLLIFNMMFAMLDWHNVGYSFIVGLIWIGAYKKTGHLLTTMIAHGGANLIGIIFLLVTNGVV